MNEFSSKIQSESDGSKVKESVQRAADSAASAGSRVSEFATESAENLKGRASDFVDTAKGMASDASNRLQQTVNEQKGAGAEYVSRLAHSLDRAADQVEGEFPIAGSYMRTASSQVQMAAEALRTGNLEDLVRSTQAFAKRQPTLFLGAAFLVGFGVVRFLRSSSSVAASNYAPRYGNGNRRSDDPGKMAGAW